MRFVNRTKPGTALIETALTGDPLYYAHDCSVKECTVFLLHMVSMVLITAFSKCGNFFEKLFREPAELVVKFTKIQSVVRKSSFGIRKTFFTTLVLRDRNTKGHLISKGLFDVTSFRPKNQRIFLRISALASKKR